MLLTDDKSRAAEVTYELIGNEYHQPHITLGNQNNTTNSTDSFTGGIVFNNDWRIIKQQLATPYYILHEWWGWIISCSSR